MIADHTRTGQEMMPAAEADSVSVPEKLEKKHQAKLEALKAADKSVFDNMYRAKQLKAHESAVALFSEYAKTAKRRIEDLRCQIASDAGETFGTGAENCGALVLPSQSAPSKATLYIETLIRRP